MDANNNYNTIAESTNEHHAITNTTTTDISPIKSSFNAKVS